ncbi:MAG: NAD(P)-dependent dehydrogenase, short-chain alcohol dehydrogenase family [Chloroflexi bacterium]|jgi:NAD(P)-dependent dehydrogenase (short-subunit alcohol dehydrogenase family)|nr:MAG: NAD(P)-dependent dehydrogenase, short-chain alcohol dehydrogenase family [Chloroflexota bacterium]
MRLEGKVALVTGFGSGIGRSTAVIFAREGAKIIGLSRSGSSGEETARLVREAGSEALFVPTDIRKLGDVEAALAKGLEAFGRLDIAVNSAGVRVAGIATDLSEEDWDTALDTNLKGAFLVGRAAIPQMRLVGGGSIINISAASGFHGTKGRVAYSTSKGALNNFTEAMALDYAGENIRVNCICPGPTETPMMGTVTDEVRAAMSERVPMGAIPQPEDIAEAAVFLASDAAHFITGAILAVDGGSHLAPSVHGRHFESSTQTRTP